jgi:hypothetical protein
MSTFVTAPVSVVQPIAAGGGGPAPTGTIVGDAAGGQAAPPVGTVLNGVVAVQQPNGLTQLRLDDAGLVQIRTGFPLLPDTEVALRIAAAGPPARFVLLSVNGRPVRPPATAPTAQPAPAGTGGTAPAGVAAPATPPALGPGTVVSATVTRLGPTLPGAPPNAPPAAGGGAAVPADVAVGSRLGLRVVAVGAPEVVAANTGGALLSGTIGGTTAAGHAVVRTAIGVLTFAARDVPPPGSQIAFEVVGAAHTPAHSTPPLAAGPLALSQEWPALREALQLLLQADPGIAQSVLNGVVPRPDSRLGPALLLLIGALRGGDLRGWLGQAATRALERASGPGLLQRLGGDLATLRSLAVDGAGDWRAFFLPVYDGDLSQVRIFIHRRDPNGAGDDPSEDPGKRFVVEVDLSRLGAVQLDGLVRQRRFDLVVRSHEPWDEAMRRDIAGIFVGATEAAGFGGTITFQALATFPVAPTKEFPAMGTGVVV